MDSAKRGSSKAQVDQNPSRGEDRSVSTFPPSVQAAYQQHKAAVFRRCQSLLKDKALAEDATQDVFLKLAANEQRIQNPKAQLAWLLQTATNHCLSMLRGSHRTESLDAKSSGDDDAPHPEQPSHRLTAQYEAREFSQKLMEDLGTVSRDIALSVLAQGEERQVVAGKLKVSRKTVTRKLASISARAKNLLARKRHD
jgi:RNA polymerase sigma-70 factor (ECF subfamily)